MCACPCPEVECVNKWLFLKQGSTWHCTSALTVGVFVWLTLALCPHLTSAPALVAPLTPPFHKWCPLQYNLLFSLFLKNLCPVHLEEYGL